VAKQEFFHHYNVRIEIWHREWLDRELTKQPDVVADLFSEARAERASVIYGIGAKGSFTGEGAIGRTHGNRSIF
jgi:hypothetical protein